MVPPSATMVVPSSILDYLGVEFGAISVELGQRGLEHTEEDPVIDPFNYGSDAFSSHYVISSISAGVVNAG
jgi:hypothetical protein